MACTVVHAHYPTFNPPLLYMRALTPSRQTQAFNPPFVKRTCMHTHAHAYHAPTRTLTRLLEKGIRIWEGMVLCIRPSLAIGIHTLGRTIRVCEGGGGGGGGGAGRPGVGDKVVGLQLHVYNT